MKLVFRISEDGSEIECNRRMQLRWKTIEFECSSLSSSQQYIRTFIAD
jgi:hypothetical protein